MSIDTATIEDAQVRGAAEQVAVRFVTKLITVTRDKAGTVIDGHPETVVDIVDLWTFSRTVNAPRSQLAADRDRNRSVTPHPQRLDRPAAGP